jgi:hypothetical protein
MSERETQTPGPPIVDDQNAMLSESKASESKPGESKCPFSGHMLTHTTAGAKGNNDWWPDQLNLGILHQQSSLSNPMGEKFDYAQEFKSLNLDAARLDDRLTGMVAGRFWPLRAILHPHGLAFCGHLPHLRRTRRRW